MLVWTVHVPNAVQRKSMTPAKECCCCCCCFNLCFIALLTVCLFCVCSYSIPRAFPEDCMSVFNSSTCEYIVHKKDDPTVLCPIFGAVGK